jgi:hypothetical protein
MTKYPDQIRIVTTDVDFCAARTILVYQCRQCMRDGIPRPGVFHDAHEQDVPIPSVSDPVRAVNNDIRNRAGAI